ncbi:sel1 repeat family protein [Marinomonas balearica]|uniref:Sel1 repeat-containing protein n=1 Tax=Marinomonas balearica TaxID=491947 RepID=A0A4R6M3W2_9GAMM|nr:sel1 repeat family protein [Marinomonas balearica]TDO95365.1 hypothetical protein DFP79_3606 [Marinomonas balearica]
MSRIILIFSLIFCSSVIAEECKVKYLEELDYTDIECQFYMGTAAYRNKVYSVAAAHWNYVINSPLKYEGEEVIKAMALSTKTFLTYQGLGLKQDRNKAVKNWIDAVSKGDLEARRHLGFAYSDEKFKNKDPIKALGWYESIFLLHPNKDEVDESDLGVYQDAIDGAEKLRNSLSSKQKEAAISFAKSTL